MSGLDLTMLLSRREAYFLFTKEKLDHREVSWISF